MILKNKAMKIYNYKTGKAVFVNNEKIEISNKVAEILENYTMFPENMYQDLGIEKRPFVQDKDGEPIVGATVLIEGTNMGTVTDVDGRFVMSASKEDKLVVSYIGMKGTKVKVASKVTITLKDE